MMALNYMKQKLLIIWCMMIIILNLHTAEGGKNIGKPPPVVQLHPDIKKICDATDHPKVCRSSILPFLNDNKKTDPASVLVMQINAAIKATERAIQIAKAHPRDPRFRICMEQYDFSMDDWKNALASAQSRESFELANSLTGVVSMIMSCEDAFTGGDPNVNSNSPLTRIDQNIKMMTANALAIRPMAFPAPHRHLSSNI